MEKIQSLVLKREKKLPKKIVKEIVYERNKSK